MLVVERNPEVRELLARQLEHLGYRALAGRGSDPGLEGFDAALIEPGDAIGLALAQELRARDADLPIVFVSIWPASAATAALRPVVHLEKPIRLRQLADAFDGVSRAAAHAGARRRAGRC